MAENKVPELPQHVLDTRYLKDLAGRIVPPRKSTTPSVGEEEEEETTVELVGYDLHDAADYRCCACDPDQRQKLEGPEKDSDDQDGWFCTFRIIDPDLKIHVLLDQARLEIHANPSDFPKDIREEIEERFLLEYDKDFQKRSNREKICPPPSPPPPPVFPPFSFQHLPPEILVEIVLLAQASNPHIHITLSHVDASLRAFVNSTPLLWSRIDFWYPLRVVHAYLERSADTLLKVTALPPFYNISAYHRFLEDVKRDEYSKIMQFFSALRPHRHRILSLRLRSDDLLFDVSAENDGQTIAHDFLWDGSMVKLERLDLELVTWMAQGLREIPSSDSIKELHLRGPWTMHYMPLFSTRLKSLVFANQRASFSKILDALEAAPCLTSLTFQDVFFTGIKAKEGSVLNLDHLESLSLIRVFGSAAEGLGKCIVAPNLVSYTFQHAIVLHQVDEWRDISKIQLFSAPQPSVRRLDLTACDRGPSFFDSAFRTFPCITHLRIASSNLSHEHLLGAVVKPVSEWESGRMALPDLEHLTIENEFNGISGAFKLIAFSRHLGGRNGLKSMTLRGIPVDSDAAQDDIEMLESIIPNFEVEEFDQDLDVYGESDDSASETSSIGSWASGDHEVLAAFKKVWLHFRFLLLENLIPNIKYHVPEDIPGFDEDSQNEGEE